MLHSIASLMAGMFLAVMACDAGAQTTATQDATARAPEPGTQQSNGAATWNIKLTRRTFEACPDDVYVTTKLGHIDGPCARFTVMVRNDSSLPVQCLGLLEFARPDRYGKSQRIGRQVIFPSVEKALVEGDTTEDNSPTSHGADCMAIPDGPLPPLETRPECETQLSAPSPDTFFPPASRRRGEQGDVVLEFTAMPDSKAGNVRVVQSSGFADLDNAALRLSDRLRAQSTCPDTRMRLKLKFRISDRVPAAAPAG